MIPNLCASCGRNTARNLGRDQPYGVIIRAEDGRLIEVVRLCGHCCDPARFSVTQLAEAITAEFARQATPTSKKAAS